MTSLEQRREFNGGVMFDWKVGGRVVATIALYAEGLVEFQGKHEVTEVNHCLLDVFVPLERQVVSFGFYFGECEKF